MEVHRSYCPTGKYLLKVIFNKGILVLVAQKDIEMMKLNENNCLDLPVFFTIEGLRKSIGVKKKYFYKVLYCRDTQYKILEIPKRNGVDVRELNAPVLPLKSIQRWILENILYKIPVEECVNGFVPGKSIVSNAYPHLKSKYIVKMDIVDFFPSIQFGVIKKYFYEIGYSNKIANALASLCTFDYHLPQGAPTSPYLANLICFEMDRRIKKLCLKHNLKYTRYADDITISGDSKVFWIKDVVEKIVNSYNFEINREKTVLLKPGDRKRVTGIIVNEKLSVPKNMVRELRKNIYFIQRYGINSHLDRIQFKGLHQEYISKLYGIVSFIKMVDLEKGLFFKSLLDDIFNSKSIDINSNIDFELGEIDWEIFDD